MTNKDIIPEGCFLSRHNDQHIEEYHSVGAIRICPSCGTANDYQWIAIPVGRGDSTPEEIQCLVCGTMSQEDNWMV